MNKFSCHCGNIKIETKSLPPKFVECNCSTCGRYGSKWAYFSPGEVTFTYSKENICGYLWGKKEVEFFHCTKCGCMTHYALTSKASQEKVAINGRMLVDREKLDSTQSKHFDGRDTWTMISE